MRFECKRERKWRRCESPKTIRRGLAGKPTLRVRAIDRDGNVDPTPAKVKLKRRR